MHVRSILWPLFGAAAIAWIDQAVKFVVLAMQPEFTVIPGFLAIGPASDAGAAFNLFRQFPRMLTVLGILLVAILIGYYGQRAASVSRREQTGVALVVGGATGNLIDRLRLGYVVDYLNVFVSGHQWPFNLADWSIIAGAACLALASIPYGSARRSE